MYPLIQDVAKFYSQSDKYKMDLYPELGHVTSFGWKLLADVTHSLSEKSIPHWP